MSNITIETEPESETQQDLLKLPPPLSLEQTFTAAAPSVESETVDAIVNYVRSLSKEGQIVERRCFLEPPFSFPIKAFEAALEWIVDQSDYRDIGVAQGDKDSYYYSSADMTFTHANTLVSLLENDICKVIAEAVRFESEMYPYPYKQKRLERAPYHFSEGQIETALALMAQQSEYKDIQLVKASNGEPYLFSNLFITDSKAKSLCEWFEVGSK